MEFTLTYDGPLASNGRPAQKHEIRRQLHPQLKELWTHQPLALFKEDAAPGGEQFCTVGDHHFTSVIHKRFHLRAHLNILMLRPETPGRLIVGSGDIDNRMKTLFDALTRPTQPQDIPKAWVPHPDEDPLHCLLDDDDLITGVSINTERLLGTDTPSHVRLIIGVRMWTPQPTYGSMALLG